MRKDATKTREQLAEEYGISRKTLYSWLKNAGIKLKKRLLTPKEQETIYNTFGNPNS